MFVYILEWKRFPFSLVYVTVTIRGFIHYLMGYDSLPYVYIYFFFFSKGKIVSFIYLLFLAVLGLYCCAWTFLVKNRGYFLVVVCEQWSLLFPSMGPRVSGLQ